MGRVHLLGAWEASKTTPKWADYCDILRIVFGHCTPPVVQVLAPDAASARLPPFVAAHHHSHILAERQTCTRLCKTIPILIYNRAMVTNTFPIPPREEHLSPQTLNTGTHNVRPLCTFVSGTESCPQWCTRPTRGYKQGIRYKSHRIHFDIRPSTVKDPLRFAQAE